MFIKKKKQRKTAKKPCEYSIEQCKESLLESFNSDLRDSFFGVLVANIILSYSHILIEGIYRIGHNDDFEWREIKNQAANDYNMHRLVLKPRDIWSGKGDFDWKYEYMNNQKSGNCDLKSFHLKGKYEIMTNENPMGGNKIGGKTELKLMDFRDSTYGYYWNNRDIKDLVGIIDCDKDLVMSFENKYPQMGLLEDRHHIWKVIDGKQGKLILEKCLHSLWLIPK